MTVKFMNDFRVFQWFSTFWMILQNFNDFEYLNEFWAIEWFPCFWIWRFWLIFLADHWFSTFWFILDFLIITEWLSSIWMIIEIFDYFREFGRYSSLWMKYENMIDFRVLEWNSRISIFLKFIIPPLTPICKASREGTREAYFRRFEWISSIWMIFEILIFEFFFDYQVFDWYSSFWIFSRFWIIL